MKRRMKLLLANLMIGALTLVYGCPLWWIVMIDIWKAAILRLLPTVRRMINDNMEGPKSRKPFWNENKRKGEQLI